MTAASLPFLNAEDLAGAVSWQQAIQALTRAISLSSDLSSGVPRTAVPTGHGELLLMPAESGNAVGVKLLSVAPDNPAAGLPRIQALYVLFDAVTLTPRLLIDGAALTTLRTPALSALAVDRLAVPEATKLTVFGAGPQAQAHVHAIRAVRPIEAVTVVSRRSEPAERLVRELQEHGVQARTGTPDGAVASTDLVVCATTARRPLFDGDRLAGHACVIAVGSHEPDARELDERVFQRAGRIAVEDAGTALREAGDIILAVKAGSLTAERLIGLSELVSLVPDKGISVFKSVGMGWQDLAVAEAAAAAWRPGNS